MAKKTDKPFRKELTSAFSEAARKKETRGLLNNILRIAEHIRSEVLMPATRHLEDIEIHRKDTGDMRGADEKTFSIQTDNECEDMAQTMLRAAYPDALILGEEDYGVATPEEKQAQLEAALATDKLVFVVDALDGTSNFRTGGDGFGVMISAIQHGEVKASVVYRCTDHADPDGYGHTITYDEQDGVRVNGRRLTALGDRTFTNVADKMRGYAGFEYIKAMKTGDAGEYPDLSGAFDSISDLWTCPKALNDMLRGETHFTLVPPPADLFDYPAGITIIQQAGGVVKFLDGTNASFAEIVKRQPYHANQNSASATRIHNTLVFAVSETVFATVQQAILGPSAPKAQPKPGF